MREEDAHTRGRSRCPPSFVWAFRRGGTKPRDLSLATASIIMVLRNLALLLAVGSASAFVPSPLIARTSVLGAASPMTVGAAPVVITRTPQQLQCARRVQASPAMGLFGLGWPEIGVIGVLVLLFFGPDRLAPLAKDLGKQAAGLKEVLPDVTDAKDAALSAAKDVTASFQEGMAEGEAGLTEKGATAKPTEGSEVKDDSKPSA